MTVPASTYRLQLSEQQDFAAARDLVGYLEQLGVGALYCSPILAATPGSTHGYDVVDPTRTNEELGGDAGRRELVAALRHAGLGVLVDIVPNHMGVAVPPANPSWWDVLRHGPGSAYASWYDVDWDAGPVLLPVLGSPEGTARLEVVGDELHYYGFRVPLAPGTGGGTPAEVHERQHYRLVHWRRGNAELTYRRFFDVSDLAAVRVEDPAVFEATHAEILRWRAAGELDGLRVDHPDGLSAPGEYVRRLRAALDAAGEHTGHTGRAWLLVEKILGVGEALPASWPVDGTTGYDALREIGGVFVDPRGESLVDQVAAEHTGARSALGAVEHEAKRLVTDEILVAEVRRIAASTPGGHDPATLDDAVAELLAAFPVYRSYLPEGAAALARAVDTAVAARPELAEQVRAVHAAVVADPDGTLARRLEQTSGMVTAKGVEDTTFYRWNRFVALNEVGGAPDRFGVTVAELHAAAARRAAASPASMTTLSTHDTKRSEDTRARLAVLAERPADWGAALRRWSRRHPLPSAEVRSPSLELLAWQTVIGAWPISAERLAAYLVKAAKEAKLVTGHTDPVVAVDDAIGDWPSQVLATEETVAEIEELVAGLEPAGRINALGQKVLQIAGPGVPDVYQGTELFDHSLVDPDNRRPVDFEERRRLLARLDGGWVPALDAADPEEVAATKLLATSAGLRLRRLRPDLFTGYRPLAAEGRGAEHAVAFARGGPAGHERLVAVATRLPVRLADTGGWGDTVLPLPGAADDWTDVISGAAAGSGAPRLADLLARFPVALLVRPA